MLQEQIPQVHPYRAPHRNCDYRNPCRHASSSPEFGAGEGARKHGGGQSAAFRAGTLQRWANDGSIYHNTGKMKMASSPFLVGDSFALSMNCGELASEAERERTECAVPAPPRTGMPSSFPFRWRSSTVREGTAAAASAVKQFPNAVVLGDAPRLSVAAALGVRIVAIQNLGELTDAAVAHDHFA